MKFSFVILAWNRRAFLEKCLSSLVASIDDFSDAEIVVMDNGSTDDTPDLLAQFAGDPRFRLFRLRKNYGLNGFKRLFGKARGDYVVMIDDDVIAFPPDIKGIFETYMTAFPDYGFLSLDVVQNEFTNGAKPPAEHYVDDERGGRIVQRGPAGAWCACFRRRDYRRVKPLFWWRDLSLNIPHDGHLTALFRRWLDLKCGVIKDVRCFHACGPHYSREYGFLDHDIEKYRAAGLDWFVEKYGEYK